MLDQWWLCTVKFVRLVTGEAGVPPLCLVRLLMRFTHAEGRHFPVGLLRKNVLSAYGWLGVEQARVFLIVRHLIYGPAGVLDMRLSCPVRSGLSR